MRINICYSAYDNNDIMHSEYMYIVYCIYTQKSCDIYSHSFCDLIHCSLYCLRKHSTLGKSICLFYYPFLFHAKDTCKYFRSFDVNDYSTSAPGFTLQPLKNRLSPASMILNKIKYTLHFVFPIINIIKFNFTILMAARECYKQLGILVK